MHSGTERYVPFPSTHWSLVKRAGLADQDVQREAIATLLSRYLPALRSFLMTTRRLPEQEAEEVLQAFVMEKILERQLFAKADADRGKFRTFLMTSLAHFVADMRRRESRQRAVTLSDRTTTSAPEPSLAMEVEWARILVRTVTEEMQAQCRENGRLDIWTIFEKRVLADAFTAQAAVSYSDIVQQMHLASPVQAANLLITGKRMYARLMRAAIAEYEPDEHAIEYEISYLREVLRQSSHLTG